MIPIIINLLIERPMGTSRLASLTIRQYDAEVLSSMHSEITVKVDSPVGRLISNNNENITKYVINNEEHFIGLSLSCAVRLAEVKTNDLMLIEDGDIMKVSYNSTELLVFKKAINFIGESWNRLYRNKYMEQLKENGVVIYDRQE